MMNKAIILLIMVFLHIVDDYYLQGLLAKMKQRSWWQENAPDGLYKHDYIVALVAHGFSWTFMVMLPITILLFKENAFTLLYFVAFLVNVLFHAVIDDFKANKRWINLVTDQLLHLIQILMVWTVFFVY